MLILAILTVMMMSLLGVELAVGSRSLTMLQTAPPLQDPKAAPRVSIIIPARNEETSVREALASVLMQDYPDYEEIAVNDRSEDHTGALLDEMASEYPRLTVVHLTELPVGWLGKNHALFVGAGLATGSIYLFTDADVVMEPSAVSRAVHHLLKNNLDHVTVIPRLNVSGFALTTFVSGFAVFFGAFSRPWRARNPRSRAYAGVGAFNMIRADAYRSIGGHPAIAMRPDDDTKLGKLVKRFGFRQEVLNGQALLSVRWYASLRELIGGLMKNTFAALGYNVGAVLGAILLMSLLGLWPLAALGVTDGVTRLLNGITVALTLLIVSDTTWLGGSNRLVALGYPFAVAVLIYILVRAALMTLIRGGIAWRGTRYPLAQLKANRV